MILFPTMAWSQGAFMVLAAPASSAQATPKKLKSPSPTRKKVVREKPKSRRQQGQVRRDENSETEAQTTTQCNSWQCRRERARERIRRENIREERGGRGWQSVAGRSDMKRTPIWKPFATAWAACAPRGCQPSGLGVHREKTKKNLARNRGRSCHYSDRAIDVEGMICNGRAYPAIKEAKVRGKFSKVVACISEKMITLYQQVPKRRRRIHIVTDHWTHAHFSIGCYYSAQKKRYTFK